MCLLSSQHEYNHLHLDTSKLREHIRKKFNYMQSQKGKVADDNADDCLKGVLLTVSQLQVVSMAEWLGNKYVRLCRFPVQLRWGAHQCTS